MEIFKASLVKSRLKILSSPNVEFIKMDLTKYDVLRVLFDMALKTFERIDCAISNAGVVEIGIGSIQALT